MTPAGQLPPAQQAQVDRLRKWLTTGGTYISDALVLSNCAPTTKARGLMLVKSVPKNEVLISVPRNFWLTAEGLLPGDIEQKTTNESWDLRLAAGVTSLLKDSQKRQEWEPFLELLPTYADLQEDLPYLWNRTRLQADRWNKPWLEGSVLERREQIIPIVNGSGAWEGQGPHRVDEVAYAYSLVLSRVFGVDEMAVIAPLLDMANHAPKGGTGVRANSRPVILENWSPVTQKEELASGDGDEEDEVNMTLGLATNMALPAGTEILFEYGPYSNVDLFFQYGFECKGNPYGDDTFDWQKEFQEYIRTVGFALLAYLVWSFGNSMLR